MKQTAVPRSGSLVESARFWRMLVIVWILSMSYAALYLKRGWIPHDDGAFAQSAERVLNGELPHRDFDDTYTGGLAMANALAFRVFGVNLASLRIPLFGVFALWIPAVFYIATRFAGAYTSAGLTLLAAAWSIPNYSAAVPSWYNLLFAVFGTAALLRYIDTRSRRWLFIAGICAGLSITVKIIGLYFVAAVLLFLAYREQSSDSDDTSDFRMLNRLYWATIILGYIATAFLLAIMIVRVPYSRGLVYFLFPPCALMAVLISRELSKDRVGCGCRFTMYFKMLVPFAAGTVLPVLIFLIPYIRSGAIGALVHGVFVLPTERFEVTSMTMAPPGLDKMATLVPISILLFLAYRSGGKARMIYGVFLGVYLSIVLEFSVTKSWAYSEGWFSMATAIPLVTAVAAILLGVPRFSYTLDNNQQQRLMLLFSVLSMISLVQFPFSAPIYFCYAAPILILAAAALFAFIPGPPRLVLGVMTAFYLLFVIWRVTPAFVYNMGYTASPALFSEELNLPRGGQIRVDPIDAQVYENLIPLIREHEAGDFTYADPDCPEIYFLTGLKNPTRTLYDSFDDPSGRTKRILNAIDAHHITVLTFNEQPSFAGRIDQNLEDQVKDMFPYSKQIGHFRVRWKE